MAPLPLHPWHPHYEDLLCLFMIIWSGYKEGDNPTPEEGSQPKCPLGLSLLVLVGGGRLCFLLIFTPLLINTTLSKQCNLFYKWLGLKVRLIIFVSFYVFIACCTLSTSNRTFLSQCTSFLFPSEVFHPGARGNRKEMRCKSVQSGIKASYSTNPFGLFCSINYQQIKTNTSGWWSKITLL